MSAATAVAPARPGAGARVDEARVDEARVDEDGEGEPSLHRRRYIPAFDGLRALLVLGVLLYHLSGAGLPTATGEVAVIAFFSLSGFLITFLLADEHRETGTIRLRAFFRRRALRLFPAMLVLLALWAVVALVFGHDPWITAVPGGGAGAPIHPLTVAETVGAALAYVTNWLDALLQYHLWAGYSPLGHLWSLAVEEQFYLVWAPVMLLLCRMRRTGWWLVLMATGFLAEPLLLYAQGTNRVYFGTDTRMCALLVGAALGWWWRSGHLVRLERSVATPLLGAASSAGLLVAGVGFRFPDVGWEWVGGLLLASLSGGGLVLYLANRADDTVVARMLGRPWLVWLGRRSYAVYLWGYVFNTWFRSLGPACPLVTVLCTLAMAECSYRLVERPMRDWVRRPRPRRAPPRLLLGPPPVPALAEG